MLSNGTRFEFWLVLLCLGLVQTTEVPCVKRLMSYLRFLNSLTLSINATEGTFACLFLLSEFFRSEIEEKGV